MRKQRRIAAEDYDEIRAYARAGVAPADIWRRMHVDGVAKVSLPTIRGIWREFSPPSGGEPWSLATAESREEAVLILRLLRSLRELSHGHIQSVTQEEAEMLIRIYWVAPESAPVFAWASAREYIRRKAAGEPLHGLDVQYAYIGDPKGWERAVAAGIVDATVSEQEHDDVMRIAAIFGGFAEVDDATSE